MNGKSNTIELGNTSDDKSEDKQGETLVGSFLFSEGDNEVRLTPIWTWAVVDYVWIEKDGEYSSIGSNNVSLFDDEAIIYYSQAEDKLYVNTKKEGTLRIIDLNGTIVDTIQIIPNKNEIQLKRVPKGVYLVCLDNLTVKITR